MWRRTRNEEEAAPSPRQERRTLEQRHPNPFQAIPRRAVESPVMWRKESALCLVKHMEADAMSLEADVKDPDLNDLGTVSEHLTVCPRCKGTGKKSCVYHDAFSFRTAMMSSSYYDEAGQFHYHDRNTTTRGARCSNGHHWTEKTTAECALCRDSEIRQEDLCGPGNGG